MLRWLLVCAVTVAGLHCAYAADVSPNGFLARHESTIDAPPSKVYDALVRDVGSWWSEQHTYSGDSRNLSIDARPGGCFCERLPNGGVEHMRVVQVRSNEMLRMAGALGPLQASGVSGSLTWKLSPAGTGTRLELTYSVGGFIAGGFDAMAPAVERVLGEQAQRLKRYVETGTPNA
ncbi:MAG TPA: SRPBCC family protein [Casimicrobiaceae bacterium]|jgi:uncharacterized protein YndB with AHSA1/START domain